MLGKYFEKYNNRDKVVIQSKCGVIFTKDHGVKLDNSANHVRESCEESLRRLKTNYIDI